MIDFDELALIKQKYSRFSNEMVCYYKDKHFTTMEIDVCSVNTFVVRNLDCFLFLICSNHLTSAHKTNYKIIKALSEKDMFTLNIL